MKSLCLIAVALCLNVTASGGDSKTFTNGIGQKMIWVPAGSFRMGDLTGNGSKNEKPVRTVKLSGYYLGATEVTQEQYYNITGESPSVLGPGADLPVETVSWHDAVAFCKKLTEQEKAAGRLPSGYAYVLPTEAEWENACRAGTTDAYAGDLDAMGWYKGNSGGSGGKLHPVGGKRANAWGFYDMHGNVWEWCWDWYGNNYDAGDTENPEGADSGRYRVFRGGGWLVSASDCRSASRFWSPPVNRGSYQGFRVALSSRREP